MSLKIGSNYYSNEISKYRKINEKEVRELFNKKTKKEAAKEIVERNLQFMRVLIHSWKYNSKKNGICMQDMMSAASLALLKATHSYNPSKGSYYKYMTRYVMSYLEAEFYKHLNYSRIEGKKRLKLGLDINPTDSLQKLIHDNGKSKPLRLQDVIPDPDSEKYLVERDVENIIMHLIRNRDSFHKYAATIIQYRFSIGCRKGMENLSYQTIARMLKLSREAVRKIEHNTIKQLKKYLE